MITQLQLCHRYGHYDTANSLLPLYETSLYSHSNTLILSIRVQAYEPPQQVDRV